MRKIWIWKWLALLGVISLACFPTGQVLIGTPVPTEQIFSVDKIQVDYVYTSNLITVIYPLYGSKLDDFLIVTLTNGNTIPVKVLVESEISGYSDKAMDTVELQAGETLEIRQNPRLLTTVIDELNMEEPAQISIHVAALVEGVEKPLLAETAETVVYAHRDFPWSIPGFSQAEAYQLLASMVTPNDASVEELLRLAADYTDSGIIWGGYGDHVDDEDGGVWDRLDAIWQAEEQNYNLVYVNTPVSFAPGAVQRIRFPAEVLEQNGGNCIELALLYASAAEALNLESAIILIPGHAYVGVRTDEVNANYYFIETTLIGRSSFAEAVERGSQEFEDALPHIDAEEESFGWVEILDAREAGIYPLPWR
jgi:hypothetical protein